MAIPIRIAPQPEDPARDTLERLLARARTLGLKLESQDPRKESHSQQASGYAFRIRLTQGATTATLESRSKEGDDRILHIERRHADGRWFFYASDIREEAWDELLPLRTSAYPGEYHPLSPECDRDGLFDGMCEAFLTLSGSKIPIQPRPSADRGSPKARQTRTDRHAKETRPSSSDAGTPPTEVDRNPIPR